MFMPGGRVPMLVLAYRSWFSVSTRDVNGHLLWNKLLRYPRAGTYHQFTQALKLHAWWRAEGISDTVTCDRPHYEEEIEPSERSLQGAEPEEWTLPSPCSRFQISEFF